jgi:uncharacterized protein YbaR (Trm112 family)
MMCDPEGWMLPDLLEIIACPKCKERVTLDATGTFFPCARCRVKYPVSEDIPDMLIEHAVPDPSPEKA